MIKCIQTDRLDLRADGKNVTITGSGGVLRLSGDEWMDLIFLVNSIRTYADMAEEYRGD